MSSSDVEAEKKRVLLNKAHERKSQSLSGAVERQRRQIPNFKESAEWREWEKRLEGIDGYKEMEVGLQTTPRDPTETEASLLKVTAAAPPACRATTETLMRPFSHVTRSPSVTLVTPPPLPRCLFPPSVTSTPRGHSPTTPSDPSPSDANPQ